MAKQKDSGFFTYRKLHFIGLSLSATSVAVAATSLGPQLGDIQCAACTAARFCLLCLTCFYLIGFLFNPWKFWQRLLGLACGILSTIGLLLVSRYLWVAPTTPTSNSDCGLQLDTWLGVLPKNSDLALFFTEQNECLNPATNLMGLSLPHITLAIFIVLFAISWRIVLRNPRQRISFF